MKRRMFVKALAGVLAAIATPLGVWAPKKTSEPSYAPSGAYNQTFSDLSIRPQDSIEDLERAAWVSGHMDEHDRVVEAYKAQLLAARSTLINQASYQKASEMFLRRFANVSPGKLSVVAGRVIAA